MISRGPQTLKQITITGTQVSSTQIRDRAKTTAALNLIKASISTLVLTQQATNPRQEVKAPEVPFSTVRHKRQLISDTLLNKDPKILRR